MSEAPETESVEGGVSGVDSVVEQLMDQADAQGAQLLGPDGLLTQVTQRLLERALDAELTEHLGYEKGDLAGHGSGNSRNGVSTTRTRSAVSPVSVRPTRKAPTAAET